MFVGLHDDSGGYGARSPAPFSTAAASAGVGGEAGGNVDRVLFDNLVEMVPLVQSLIERKASSSFTRRGSMTYTKKPSADSYTKKIIEHKGKSATQSNSRNFSSDNEKAELTSLRKQLEDLQRKLAERDEHLKSGEHRMNQLTAKFDELKHQAAEKDSIMKSAQSKLNDSKMKLADEQAALEKLQWEAQTSNRKVESLQEDLDSVQGEMSSLMLMLEGLTVSNSSVYTEDLDIMPNKVDYLPEIDDLDEMERLKIERARDSYMVAIAEAKEKQDGESIAVAAGARLHLQSCLFRTGSMR